MLRAKAGIYKFAGCHVDGQVVCETELMCTMRTVA